MVSLNGAALLGNNSNVVYDPDSGVWVNREFQHIAEIINEFDPRLFMVYIPEADRTEANVKPFAIVEAHENGEVFPVMFFDESRINHNLLADLFAMRANTQNLVEYLQKQDEAAEILKRKVWLEKVAEANEKARFMLKTPLHTVRMDGKVHHL